MSMIDPTRYGKYLLLEKLATGGMAQLYRGKIVGVQGFEKIIAIKQILPHLSTEKELVDAFIDEAKLAGLLNHQNIVQIYDFGQIEDSYFICMEYLFGKDLRVIASKSYERQVPLGLQNALYIATRICAGLDYAHKLKDFQGKALNIIHRDISPQNIFITYEGEVKILDFGIAKAASQSTITQMGMIKGKVAYMSPEQASGNPIDHRSDIFSAGILFYEMLSGRKMFQGDTMQILAKVRRAEFDPPEAAIPAMPVTLYRILHQALAKEPSDRYQTCGEMLADLEECMVGLEIRPSSRTLGEYMKGLFTQEIAAEGDFMRDAAEASARPEPEVAPPAMPPAFQEPQGIAPTPAPAAPRKLGTPLLAGIGVALAVAVLGGGYFLLRGAPPAPTPQREMAGTPPQPAVQPPAAGTTPAKAPPAETARTPGKAPAPTSAEKAKGLIEQAQQVAGTNPQEAVSLLLQAIGADPKSAQAHFQLGLLYAKQKEYPKAIQAYGQAADLDPKFPDTFFNLGYVYALTKEYRKAEEMYARVATLEPPYIDEALYNLAIVQEKQGKKQKAIESLERAVRTNPNNTPAEKFLNSLKRKQ
ncbi:MAG TPA: protein kinase [Candidatus Methylomirabilis sp.]|nr:protein kinase [Candidatus Methylomirabilis sp.]HSB77666.1 protein kinase [Candidatus Methylomirabilis sp.]